MSIEFESSLVIIDAHPQQFIRRFSELKSLGDYEIVDGDLKHIHDIYWDTEQADLKQANCSVRLRELSGRQLITFKGTPQRLSDDTSRRLEIEGDFNEATVFSVVDALQARHIPHAIPSWHYEEHDPRRILQDMGFETIQERLCQRQVFFVVKNQVEYCEIALDRVTYQINTRPVVHFELEIELLFEALKDTDSQSEEDENVRSLTLLNQFVTELKTRFPHSLMTWEHSKLATGMGIEYLARQQQVHTLINQNSILTAEGYRAINRALSACH